jgi:hypothetical protein
MADDYFGTVQIMQRDSRCLHDNQRWHNACYLAGYVIECGFKTGLLFDSSQITDSLLYTSWNPFDRYQPPLWDDENSSQQFQETAQYLFDFLNELHLNGTI